jgi:hypothetical protein
MGIMVFMNCKRLQRTPGADRCDIETLPSRPRILRWSQWTLCALAGGYIAASAQAAMMTTIKFQPNSADINDLDHRLAIHGGSMVSARAVLPAPALRSPLPPSPGDANPGRAQSVDS